MHSPILKVDLQQLNKDMCAFSSMRIEVLFRSFMLVLSLAACTDEEVDNLLMNRVSYTV
jgi:hypothetical protein